MSQSDKNCSQQADGWTLYCSIFHEMFGEHATMELSPAVIDEMASQLAIAKSSTSLASDSLGASKWLRQAALQAKDPEMNVRLSMAADEIDDLGMRVMRKAEHAAEWQVRAEAAERTLSAIGRRDSAMRAMIRALQVIASGEAPYGNLPLEVMETCRNVFDYLEAEPAAIGPMEEVAAERKRQIEKEGWSHKHDDGHVAGGMAVAGACYALSGASVISGEHMSWRDRYVSVAASLWPWDVEWWKPKPKEPRRDLIRAAALIVAELERLDREQFDISREHQK